MKISLWIPAMLLCYVVKIASPSCIQVGTVLFTTTDLVKKCWTESDKALLTARLVMQDVLPDPDCIDFSKPDAVITLLEYFQSCYKIISVSTYGKLQNLMLLALSDAIGGYLRAYVLPLTRRAFYAGTVSYCDAQKLFQLFDDIKVFLKTNGVGWAKPKKLCGVQFKPKPLVFPEGGEPSACSELYTIEKSGPIGTTGFCGESRPPPPGQGNIQSEDILDNAKTEKPDMENFPELKKSEENLGNRQATLGSSKMESKMIQRKRKKRYYRTGRKKKIAKTKKETVSENNNEEIKKVQKLREILVGKPEFQNYSAVKREENLKYRRECENIGEKMSSKIVIPLPTLDDPHLPYTIAVPFKIKPLRKVKNQMSAFVLEHYYSSVIKCMLSKESSKTSIKNFNAAFNSWLESQILPLLESEDWYPAFGGVLRVQETIKKLGCRKSFKEKDFRDIGFMFPDRVEVDNPKKGSGRDQIRDVENILNDEPKRNKYYIMYGFFTLGAVCVFALCSLCICCCASRRGRHYLSSSSAPSSASTTSKARRSKTLDFQFLVQFFKKNDNKRNPSQSRKNTRYGNPFYDSKPSAYDDFDSTTNYVHRVGIENRVGESAIAEAQKKKAGVDDKNLKEKGAGDVPSVTPLNFESQKQYIKSILSPFWPYQSSYAPYEKVGKEKSYPQEENLQQTLSTNKPVNKTEVETIWKKPNKKRLRKSSDSKKKTKNKSRNAAPIAKPKNEVVNVTESETISAEAGESRRRCSSCGYSETPNSQLISTNTSQTQEALKLNSSAIKFSEPAMRRQKTKTGNRSAKYSTGESYSEEEASYSTDSDSSETTLN